MKKYLAVFSVAYMASNGAPSTGTLNTDVTFPGAPRIEHIREAEKQIQKAKGFPVGSVVLTNLIPLAA